jgi:uncharacterized membrane protein
MTSTESVLSATGSYYRRIRKVLSEDGLDEAERDRRRSLMLLWEAHTIKLILMWVLVIVPVIMLVLGIVIAVAVNKSVPDTDTSDLGGF